MIFDYYMPTEIVFGAGRVAETGKYAAKYGKKALLVTGASGAKRPVVKKILESLKEAGVEAIIFDGVVPNPTVDSVHKGAVIAESEHVDMVIGVGGGSSIDTAKAIAVEAVNEGSAWDYLFYKKKELKGCLPVIAVGTTAGTGSQTTMIAVVTNSADSDKSAICYRDIFPKVAIVDPETQSSMPASVTAQSGFDAFCHNFESFISVKDSYLCDALALDAIKRIFKYLPMAIKDGSDMEARTQMAWADTLGGITNTCCGTTLPHGLGMQIGGHYPEITHGQSLAIVYPEFLNSTRPFAVKKFAETARAIDASASEMDDEEASKYCCKLIEDFLKEIGLWVGFKDFGVDEEGIKSIAACGQVLGDYKRNPWVATLPEMEELLLKCYERA